MKKKPYKFIGNCVEKLNEKDYDKNDMQKLMSTYERSY
jgi:hypothetical protein